ncbi:hypothetical protein [Acinetobacter sp.]|uniref:hypothetical protein n=1 Tax=Acinetobacter sp. TaxID=472 RepID=UPI0035AFC081
MPFLLPIKFDFEHHIRFKWPLYRVDTLFSAAFKNTSSLLFIIMPYLFFKDELFINS